MKSKRSIPYVLLTPLIVVAALFMFYPLYKVFEMSFFQANFLNPTLKTWVGIDNYKWLFNFKLFNPNYSYFVGAFSRTSLWVGCSVAIKVVVGLFGALLLNSKFLVGKKIYRSLLVIPWAIPWAMSAMMWSWTLNSQFGIVNSILLKLHLISGPLSFFSSPNLAFVTTFILDAWAGLPFMVIMIISGLQTIPESLYEAATVEGAGDFTKLVRITLPMLKPVILTVSLLSLVWTFNSFDIIWILTRGGPLDATTTLPIAIYNTSFRFIRFGGMGKASAMTIMQVTLVTLISVFYVKTLERGEES